MRVNELIELTEERLAVRCDPSRTPRRDGRAVECTGLENRRRLIAYREFESHSLRHSLSEFATFVRLSPAQVSFAPATPTSSSARQRHAVTLQIDQVEQHATAFDK